MYSEPPINTTKTKPDPTFTAPASTQLLDRAQEAAQLLKTLANPDRLMLLCQLVAGERSVTDLGVLSGIGQPSLSQQLGVLRNEQLVATRREGKGIYYRIDSPAALAILQTLYGLFCAEPVTAKAGQPATVGRKTPARQPALEA